MTGLPVRRVRAYAGQLALLGALALVAAGVITGVPRIANELIDTGLAERVDTLPYQVRDLNYSIVRTLPPPAQRGFEDPRLARLRPLNMPELTDQHIAALRPALRETITESWSSVSTQTEQFEAEGEGLPVNGTAKPTIGLRMQSGAEAAASLVEGRWPGEPPAGTSATIPIETAASVEVARALNLRVGKRFDLRTGDRPAREVVVVGIFAPRATTDPVWAASPDLVTPAVPVGQDNVPYRGVLLASPAGMTTALGHDWTLVYSWRLRVGADRLDASRLDELIVAVNEARREQLPGERMTTSLDGALAGFGQLLTAVRALLAVVQAGVLATLIGLVLLAARLTVERRREEFALLRARGGAVRTIFARTVAESLLVIPIAAAIGWLAGLMVPGRPGPVDWLVIVFAAVAALAVPVAATLGQRAVSFVAARRDLVRQRVSARRVTAEVSVLVVAAAGAFLLRRRGLSQSTGVDPYLVLVPVLLATGAALVALRALPWPLRQIGRLATRARGAVPFLGLARAGRAAPASVGPLAVLVIAISTGALCATVSATIATGRDRSAEQLIPADLRVIGRYFSPATTAELAAVPGVTAVSPFAAEGGRDLLSSGPDPRRLGKPVVMVVDGPALERVIAAAGLDTEVPAEIVGARLGEGAVPALVSPALAGVIDRTAVADVQGQPYEFRVAGELASFPGLDPSVRQFVVLPWQALRQPPEKLVRPTGFLLAGAGVDRGRLLDLGDTGQRVWQEEITGQPVAGPLEFPSIVTSRAEHRRDLERTGVNGVLSFMFGAGGAAGATLSLLAVALAVLAGARARGQVLSRLRTMGLSHRQGRSLLVLELTPLIGLATLVGVAVGAALPALLGPALGVATFSGGLAAGAYLDPLVFGAGLALVALGLATALVVEATINRRMRLGEVLRLGEEQA